jgi:Ca2+-binding EF-hand superfamily protein
MESSEKNDNKVIINVLIYAESLEKGNIISKLLSKIKDPEAVLIFYLRYPGIHITEENAQKGGVDILIGLAADSNSDYFNEHLKRYFNMNSFIPFKILSSDTDLEKESKELNSEFVFTIDLVDLFNNKLVKVVKETNKQLINLFNCFDSDHDGFLAKPELREAIRKLTSPEDYQWINYRLPSFMDVSYDTFKELILYGRGDQGFISVLMNWERLFWNILKYEIATDNMKKLENKEIKKTIKYFPKDKELLKEDFGMRINLTLALGQEKYLEFCKLNPFLGHCYTRNAPLSVLVEVKVKKEEDIKQVLETLEAVKSLIFLGSPIASQFLEKGFNIELRPLKDSIWIELSYTGEFLFGTLYKCFQEFKNIFQTFSGFSLINIKTKFQISELIELTMTEIIQNLFTVDVNIETQHKNLNFLIEAIYNKIIERIKSYYSNNAALLVTPLLYLYKQKLDKATEIVSEYDNEDLRKRRLNFMKSFYKLGYDIQLEEMEKIYKSNHQAWLTAKLEEHSTLGAFLLEPYKPLLNAIDFDNISLIISCPYSEALCKLELFINGINDFISKVII